MKILVVDDHPFVHEFMRAVLTRAVNPDAIYSARTFAEALEATDSSVDLVVLDLRMPGYDGLEALIAFRNIFPTIRLIVFSAIEEIETIRAALRLGISGYITKTSSIDEIVSAIRLIASGGVYLPQGAFVDESRPSDDKMNRVDVVRLTDRQRDVLCQLMSGLKNRDIARKLEISEHTVKQHAKAVFQVLGVSSRTEAALAGLRIGIRSA